MPKESDNIIVSGMMMLDHAIKHIETIAQDGTRLQEVLSQHGIESAYPAVVVGEGMIITTLGATLQRIIRRMSQGLPTDMETIEQIMQEEYDAHADEFGVSLNELGDFESDEDETE